MGRDKWWNVRLHAPSFTSKKRNQINLKEKEIVREVARGDEHYLRKSKDCNAQISGALVLFTGLICALRSVEYLRLCLSPRATSLAISFSISNSLVKNYTTTLTLLYNFQSLFSFFFTNDRNMLIFFSVFIFISH